ncbi:MAG: hypothetical protein ACRDQU_16570 [Pseudonocardiaceae bacterium]
MPDRELMRAGTVEGLRASDTLTGRRPDDRASLKLSVRTPSGVLEVRGASTNNLRDVDADIPLGSPGPSARQMTWVPRCRREGPRRSSPPSHSAGVYRLRRDLTPVPALGSARDGPLWMPWMWGWA